MSDKPDNNWRAEVIKEWWQKMQPESSSHKQKPLDRASLARLRRCNTIADSLNEVATIGLARRCKVESDYDLMRVGLIASVLSHVRADDEKSSNARIIGPNKQDDDSTALCKAARFRRLLATEDVEGCQKAFRRLVALMGGKANVFDLASSLWEWPFFPMQEERSKWRRVRWVSDYWDVGMSEK